MSLSNLFHLPEIVTQIIVEHIAIEVEDEEDIEAWKFVEPVPEEKLELINWLNDDTAEICNRLRGIHVIFPDHPGFYVNFSGLGIPGLGDILYKNEFLKRVKDL